MRQRNTFKLLGVVVAILVMSVGYAAIENVTLTVTGNTTVTPEQGNFKVAFTGTPTKSGIGASTTTAAITDDLTATMNVSGLTAVGDTLTATFTIANTSTDITAYLSNTATNTNTEYFEVTSTLGSTELAPQTGTTTLEVKVKLIKTPVTGDQTDTLTVEVIASPTKQAPKLISFTIDQRSFQAEEGMTWEQWCDSSYNTGGAFVDDMSRVSWEEYEGNFPQLTTSEDDGCESVYASDVIIANYPYEMHY